MVAIDSANYNYEPDPYRQASLDPGDNNIQHMHACAHAHRFRLTLKLYSSQFAIVCEETVLELSSVVGPLACRNETRTCFSHEINIVRTVQDDLYVDKEMMHKEPCLPREALGDEIYML